jgi:hypothetical protein
MGRPDYAINDGGGDFPHMAVAKELFLKFWQVPADDIRRTREGIYDPRIIGPPGMRVQIIRVRRARKAATPILPTRCWDRHSGPSSP